MNICLQIGIGNYFEQGVLKYIILGILQGVYRRYGISGVNEMFIENKIGLGS